ncbi:MAG TPA: glycosyl hydrolase [Actinomycetota bacterium]|nr:glycosyl hydrolase [Actinomycetota bacterium]
MTRAGLTRRVVGLAMTAAVVSTLLLAAAPRPAHAAASLDRNLVPSSGALLGAYVDPDARWTNNTDAQNEVRAFESSLGRRLDVNQHYYSWTNTFPSGLEQWDVQNGRIPLVTWEAWGTTLRQIDSGMYDSTIRARARGLRNLGAPVFMRWGHEMNGNWYPWSGAANNDAGTHNGPAKYVAAYRHIHDIFEAEGATNVVWVWSPNHESIPNESWNHWSAYYPGDAYVDWIGPDGYNFGESKSWSSWRSFRSVFQEIYDYYAGRKPIMIAETASVESGGYKYRWIASMWTQVSVNMPAIKALVYFHVGGDWRTNSSASAHRKFVDMANAPHFLRVADADAPRVAGLGADSGDVVRVTYESSEPAQVTVEVRSSSGRLVRTLRGAQWTSPVLREQRWHGRTGSGRLAPEGRYRFDIHAIDPAGHATTASQWVELAR